VRLRISKLHTSKKFSTPVEEASDNEENIPKRNILSPSSIKVIDLR
jgi:hypothetical protein